MLRRAFLLLTGLLGLSGCATGTYPPGQSYHGAPGGAPSTTAPAGAKVAILLPLSGARADLAQPILEAAQLALSVPGSPPLLSEDTGSTAGGAATAARAATAAQAGIVLGPLTAPEVGGAAPVARGAGLPMLAFSNDPTVAQPGIWPLGITPGQQVHRLVAAAVQAGHTRFAALLPDNDFGHALGDALSQACSAAGLQPPSIRFHGAGMSAISRAAREVSDYEGRWGPIQQQINAARAAGTAEGRRKANELAKAVPPPPPFDALLLGDTGEALTEIAAVLPYYFMGPPAVQILGPSLWADPRSGARQLRGAWYAAPDPSARTPFVQAFTARYGSPPPALADIGFDAASIARVTADRGYAASALTAAEGFTGADGWLALMPNGQVRRGLAVFRVEPGEAQIVAPAPNGPSAPGA